jgi:hypothetical protein
LRGGFEVGSGGGGGFKLRKGEKVSFLGFPGEEDVGVSTLADGIATVERVEGRCSVDVGGGGGGGGGGGLPARSFASRNRRTTASVRFLASSAGGLVGVDGSLFTPFPGR